MNKLLPIYIVLFCSLLSVKVHAVCSVHVGNATLNEIMKETGNNGDAFIEIELLDTSIPSATYDKWILKICHDEGNGQNKSSQCKNISVAAMNDATQWIWAEEPTIDKNFIDFKDGFDLSLLDENGQFIDYIQVDNYSGQNFTDSCTYDDLEYVFSIPNNIENGTKILLRQPDGTGKWEESKNLNEFPPTPGGGNDGDPVIDHFEIDTLDGQGITCEADQIIIKACADASCNTVNPDAVDVKLSINGVENKTVTVSGNNGTSTSYSYTNVGNAELSLDQDYECKDSSKPCIVVFKDSGFIISDIPTQISGKSSNEGFNATTLSLRAVETNTTTGACIGTFPDDTDVAVNLSYSCAGGDCEDLLALSNNGNSYDLTETATPQDLYFSTDSTAIFTLNYPHAAKFIINAQKDVEVEDTDGNKLIKDFSVSSNAFVERPFGIKLDFSNDTNSSNALAQDSSGIIDTDGSWFKKAGETFTLTATAMQWVSGQDVTGIAGVPDGIPDDFVVFNQNTLTAENFTGGEISINNVLLLPNLGSNPVLNIIESNSFNASTSSLDNKYSFDEVGIIELKSTLANNDYLGAGDILGAVTNVGRFIPDHFTVTSQDNGILTATCKSTPDISEPAGGLPFVYSGQMLSDSLAIGALRYFTNSNPKIVIEARNKNDALTKNYVGDFYKLSLTSFARLTLALPIGTTILAPDTDAVRLGKDDDKLVRLLANINAATLTDDTGETTYTYANSDNFVYLHEENSEINEFTSDIRLSMVSIIDEDVVSAADTDGDDTNGIILTLKPTGVPIRFGRAQLENSYGPETSALPQDLSVNYFEDGQYRVAKDDYCTPYNSSEMAITNIDLSSTIPETNIVNGKFITEGSPGETRKIELTAPGIGNTGRVCVSYEIYPWLQYKWAIDENNLQCPFVKADVDSLFNDNPRAVATFGIYRGNDRIIYQREISR